MARAPAPDSPLPVTDNGVTVLSAAVFPVRTGDSFGWRIEAAIAEPPLSIWYDDSQRNIGTKYSGLAWLVAKLTP